MRPVLVALALAGATLASLPASAGTYQSIFTLATPHTASGPSITHVVLTWSSATDAGVIGLGHITDWTVQLRSGSSVVFTDEVMSAGAVQPLAGVGRVAADLRFQFDFSSQTYRVFDTMYFGSLLSGATGTAYNTYLYQGFTGEPDAPLGIWSNGNEATRQEPGFSSHIFSEVPAPGTLAVLALVPAVRRRSRVAAVARG